MPPDKVATARQMYDSKDYTVEAIARVLGVSGASIYRHLASSATNAEEPTAGGVAPPARRKSPPRARHRS